LRAIKDGRRLRRLLDLRGQQVEYDETRETSVADKVGKEEKEADP